MNLLSRTCVGLLACATFFTSAPAQAGPDAVEYNRPRMNEPMADRRYADRINGPISNSSSSSTSSTGFGAPYQWQPRSAGDVVATYEFKVWVQETPAQAVSRLKKEAAGGNRQSQFDVGRVLYAGYREVPEDLPMARKLLPSTGADAGRRHALCRARAVRPTRPARWTGSGKAPSRATAMARPCMDSGA